LGGTLTVFLLLQCNDKEVLGPWVNKPWLNAVATVILGVLFMLSAILVVTTACPAINVTLLSNVAHRVAPGRLPHVRSV
jgi:hypothetical protein